MNEYKLWLGTDFYVKITSKASCLASSEAADWRNPMDEKSQEALKFKFDKRRKLEHPMEKLKQSNLKQGQVQVLRKLK